MSWRSVHSVIAGIFAWFLFTAVAQADAVVQSPIVLTGTAPGLNEPPAPQYTGAVPIAPILGASPIYRGFREWILACDNTRACVARYASEKDRFPVPGFLELDRQAGSQGAAKVVLAFRLEHRAPNPSQLRLDGRALGGFAWRIVKKDGIFARAELVGPAVGDFIRAIRDGKVLALGRQATAPIVPLDGMKAALTAMDDAQGRDGSVSALVNAGSRSVSTVPPPPSLPVIRAVPTKAVLTEPHVFTDAVRAANQDELDHHHCDLDLAPDDLAFMPDAGHVVVFLACNVGAYNLQGVLFIAPRETPAQARLLLLPLEPGKAPGKVSLEDVAVYNWNRYAPDTGWNAQTATFHTRKKGRGLGDCGERSAWTFDGEGFVLSAYDMLDRCDGGPERRWPTLYRSRVVVK